MDGIYRGRFGSIVITVALILLVACAGQQTGTLRSTEDQAPLRFVLAAEGLPQDGLWKSTPVFADINEDGFLDLAAIVRKGEGAHVWIGDGTGFWTEVSDGLRLEGSCGGGVAFGDINNDGYLDLAVADHCNGVYVYLGDGNGHWKASTEGLNPTMGVGLKEEPEEFFSGAEDLAVGDVNEDGFLDLVVGASDLGGLSVYFGDGSGSSWREATSDGLPSGEDPEPGDEEDGGWANQVLLHDMDGDGHLDVVASYYTGPRVWKGDGKGHWQAYSDGLPTPIIGGLFRGIAVGDINEDGHLDLAVANDINGPEVYLQQPDGSWQLTPDVLPSMMGGALGVALGDLDRDGHLDMVVAGRQAKGAGNIYGLFVCQGDGKGSWSEIKGTRLPNEGLSVTWGIAIGDVNGDGLPDLAVGTGGTVIRSTVKSPEVKAELPRMQVWLNQYAR